MMVQKIALVCVLVSSFAHAEPPLHTAVRANNVELVKQLIEQAGNEYQRTCLVNKCTPFMNTSALHIAAYYGFDDIAPVLLENGADASAGDRCHNTPLHSAALSRNKSGALEVVSALLTYKADRGAKDCLGRLPKEIAWECGFTDMLTACGYALTGDESKPIFPWDTPLHQAVRTGNLTRVQELIENRRELINTPIAGTHNMPLHLAAWYGSAAMVQELVKAGSSIDLRAALGYTPLHCAVQSGAIEVVKFLLSQGAACDIGDALGDTPLHYAAATGTPEIIKCLIQANPKVRMAQDHDSWIPYNIAQDMSRPREILDLLEDKTERYFPYDAPMLFRNGAWLK